MERLRNSLLCLFLGALSFFVVRLVHLTNQAADILSNVQSVVATAGPTITSAAMELRDAAREQRIYYKATGKALAITTMRLGRLVENTDARLGMLSYQAGNALKATDQAVSAARDASVMIGLDTHQTLQETQKQVAENGYQTTLALVAARGNLEQMEKLWPPLQKSIEDVAGSAASLEHASESIKIALEPLRQPTGRLKWVLKWLLGLPHFNVR